MKHLYNLFAVFFAITAIATVLYVNEVYEYSPVLGVLLGASSPFLAVMSHASRRMAITQSRPVLPVIKGARWISGRLYIDRDCNAVICSKCNEVAHVKRLDCVMYRATCPECGAIAYANVEGFMA